MDPALQKEADRLFSEALEAQGARDPRDYYRDQLRELKQSNPEAYQRAVRYYEETLLPAIATDGADPLQAWQAYGLRIAELRSPGRTVSIDETGRSQPYEPPGASDLMVLHLPEEKRSRPVLVSLPATPSAAQMATYDWLVAGKKKLREA